MTEKDTEARACLLRLVDTHLDDLCGVTADDAASDAKEDGTDLAAEASRADAIFFKAEASVGRSRLDAARAAVTAYRTSSRAPTTGSDRRRTAGAERLTMAARNGKEQSDRDKQGVQEDLDELEAFDDGKVSE